MSPCYSVIIPVYNAEKTLCRCVDSLLPQLRDQDELILINDGSRDGSGAICAEYAGRDARVRLIDKENGGVSSARNAGLDAARGDYVLFVDSDDWVSGDLLSAASALLAESDWDWIRFSIRPAGEPSAQPPVCRAFRSREELFPRIIDEICNKTVNSPCAKVYRRDILEREEIRFPLGASVAEDRALNIRYSMFINSYLISDQIVYYVNTENEGSLSRKQHADLSVQFEAVGEYVRRAIDEAVLPEAEKEQYRRAYNFGVCRGIYKEAKDLRREGLSWAKRQRALWKACGEINRKHMRYPKTKYCRAITLPVRLRQTWMIDLIAGRLLH